MVSEVTERNRCSGGTLSIKNLIEKERKDHDMRLLLTRYLRADPADVANQLDHAVDRGLDAAASRIAAERDDVATEQIADGVRLHGGLQLLDGSELRVSGGHRFTLLEVVVPWTSADNDGAKLLAANTFAHTVAIEVDAAA